MTIFRLCLWIFSATYLTTLSATQLQLVSTESDPDAFIQKSVNVINGDYCESATDLVISGPDAIVLQRFYSTKDVITGAEAGGWRMLPQRFLVIGKDVSGRPCNIANQGWAFALVGERSGGILPYRGLRNANGTSNDPLKIDALRDASGMVNTYAIEINGQTNHQNNNLYCKGDTSELVLGDGTKRIYQKVEKLPSLILGEELTPIMAEQVIDPEFFLLAQEILPSGNQILFSYDNEGHLIAIETKNWNLTKTFSWLHFTYEFQKDGCLVHVETSDSRELTYHLSLENNAYQLTKVEGSHCIPVSYDYNQNLVKKTLPEGRYIEIEYHDGKVTCLKGPNADSGEAEVFHTFSYEEHRTDVFNAFGYKTSYFYDQRSQLTAIQLYDDQNKLHRVERKFWGKTKSSAGNLLAKTIEDGNGRVWSYRSLQYDKSGNILEERLYGNLTGGEDIALQLSSDGKLLNADESECHIRTFAYSTDGFNLLTKTGDCKGNQTLFVYKPGTNLLTKKFILDRKDIKKRTFHTYNDDGVCIKIIEDDGSQEEESKIYGWSVTERHIKEIKPKTSLPGVGLPEIIEEKALDLQTKQVTLLKKLVNHYDDQSNLLSCCTYDANGQYAFTEKRSYNCIGLVTSQIDITGKEVNYTYDGVGNQLSLSIPQDNIIINTIYDFHNRPTVVTKKTADDYYTVGNRYDSLGRKTSSTDRFGNSTHYEYDAFHYLTKVVHPQVMDEHNQIVRPTFNYVYDVFGNVSTIQDPMGFTTKKSYNLRGNPTKINYPDGSVELFKYDAEGSLHRTFSREKIITVYEYDYLGRSIYEESSTHDEKGGFSFLRSRTHRYNGFRCTYEQESDCIKRYYFDPFGRLASFVEHESGLGERGPESRCTEIVYNPIGRIHQKKVWFDTGPQDYAVECFEYDLSGNVVEKRMENAQGNVLLRKGFSYNFQGQCTEEYTFENGRKTFLINTCYNSDGEPTAYLDGCNGETKVIPDYSFHNALGQKVLKKTLVNAIGIQTEIEFDALSRICCISKKDPFGIPLSSQKIFYDPLGNKTCETHDQIVDGQVIGSQKNRWTYGPMGRLEEEIEAADTPLAKRSHYNYNSLGQLASKTVPGVSKPINYSYHRNGKIQKIEGNQLLNKYFYDYKGNIQSAQTLQGQSILKTHNAFNQVIKETIKDGEGSYSLQYAYDRKGRLKHIILPDSSKIAYTYDAVFGREVKRIAATGEILYTHHYDQYDQQGKLQTERNIGDLGPNQYSYDLNGQKIARNNFLLNEKYTRDPLGRVLEIQGDKQELYSYNALSQLTSENKIGSRTYVYDSLDNRIKVDDNALQYNTLNQLTSDSQNTFTYDPAGNLLKKVLDGEETRFESNILSQLVSIEKADKTSVAFTYDPFGRLLVAKHLKTDGKYKKVLSTSRYLYLGHQEIGSLTETGHIKTLKIPGLQGDEPSLSSIAFEINNETYVPMHDLMGNVVAVIDPHTCQVVESYQYNAFGEEIIRNADNETVTLSQVDNPWRYAEKRMHEESGLVLFGLRFYDPTIARWISQDPAGFIDGPNRYAYLHNNPIGHLDRFGLATEANSSKQFEEYFFGEVECHCNCEKHRTCKRGGDLWRTTSSNLPKITYCDAFETFFGHYRNQIGLSIVRERFYRGSTTYDLKAEGLPDLPNGLAIGFINGIWNDFDSAKTSAQYLSKMAGGYNIHGVHNATHGRRVDLLEVYLGLDHIATEPVRQLHKMWNSFFETSSGNTKFLMICHSQGAIHVRNALLDYPPELRERILVVAVAPAAYIYQETCADVIHYRVELGDFVPYIDRPGAERAKDTIVNLTSHPDASKIFDHEFMSPTYQTRLQEHISEYIQTYGSP